MVFLLNARRQQHADAAPVRGSLAGCRLGRHRAARQRPGRAPQHLRASARSHPEAPLSTAPERELTSTLPGAIAQLGERLLCTQEVVGSIPSGSTSQKCLVVRKNQSDGVLRNETESQVVQHCCTTFETLNARPPARRAADRDQDRPAPDIRKLTTPVRMSNGLTRSQHLGSCRR